MSKQEAKIQMKKDLEQEVILKFGFIPNNFVALVESPLAAKIYLSAVEHKKECATMSFKERNIVDYIVSLHHKDEYFSSMHRNFLLNKAEISASELELYESGNREELEKMGREGWIVIATRYILLHFGRDLSESDLELFRQNGITREIWYEIASYVGLKFTNNIVNNIAKPTLDPEFK